MRLLDTQVFSGSCRFFSQESNRIRPPNVLARESFFFSATEIHSFFRGELFAGLSQGGIQGTE